MFRTRNLLRRIIIPNRNFLLNRSCSNSVLEDSEDDFLEGLNLFEMGIRNQPELEHNIGLIKPPRYRKNVVLIHPILKHVPKNSMNTTQELQIQEATALLSTLGERLRLCEVLPLNTNHELKQLMFGKGNFSKIVETVDKHQKSGTEVIAFFNVNTLTPVQHFAISKELGVDIYDRYMLVLQIFKHHSRTRAAKLQTSLAEIPYFKSRFGFYGSDDMLVHLNQREVALKSALKKLKGHRALLRQKRTKIQIPTAAVVGYTNAGKTSLIKKITESDRLRPRNQLFATLDVTCHEANLPSIGKMLYVDTVGFISDIPTQLIGSFKATLEDALLADLIVHVLDLSNPDLEHQCETVLQTLQEIETSQKLMGSILHLGNKIDLVQEPDLQIARAERILGKCLGVSSHTGSGLRDALAKIETNLIKNTGRENVKIRCRTGGSEYMEIYKSSSAIVDIVVDEEDQNYTVLEVVITPAALARVKAQFNRITDVSFL